MQMSGHSKWSQIKHQKGAADVKKGLIFTKLASGISLALREGGGITDPELNFRLRIAVDKARLANMPKENIDRAIERGTGKAGEGEIEEFIYEGYGSGKVAFLVNGATDNKNRTLSNVKRYFNENGGSLLSRGAVSYLFKQVGLIEAKRGERTEDEITTLAIEAGAQDFTYEGDKIIFYTPLQNLKSMKRALEMMGIAGERVELVFKPAVYAEIKAGSVEEVKYKQLLEVLENDIDVHGVWTNVRVV